MKLYFTEGNPTDVWSESKHGGSDGSLIEPVTASNVSRLRDGDNLNVPDGVAGSLSDVDNNTDDELSDTDSEPEWPDTERRRYAHETHL